MWTIKSHKYSLYLISKWMKGTRREKRRRYLETTRLLLPTPITLILHLLIMPTSLKWNKISREWFRKWRDQILKKVHSILQMKKSLCKWFRNSNIRIVCKVQEKHKEPTALEAESWPQVKSLSLLEVSSNSKISRTINIKKKKTLTF